MSWTRLISTAFRFTRHPASKKQVKCSLHTCCTHWAFDGQNKSPPPLPYYQQQQSHNFHDSKVNVVFVDCRWMLTSRCEHRSYTNNIGKRTCLGAKKPENSVYPSRKSKKWIEKLQKSNEMQTFFKIFLHSRTAFPTGKWARMASVTKITARSLSFDRVTPGERCKADNYPPHKRL